MEKKKISPMLVVALCIAAVLMILLVIWLIFGYRIGVRRYDNYGDYVNCGGIVYYEMPESAYDCRYASKKVLVSKMYFASMKLPDEDYEKFVNGFKTEDNKYFGMRTVDAHDDDYPANNFPLDMRFDLVTDRNIEDFTILRFSPQGTSRKHYATITCADENLVVFYKMVGF